MDICDKAGNVIATSDPPESRIFDNLVIQNASLTGMELEGISFVGSNLRGSDFTGSDLYGASLIDCKLESCRLTNTDMRSAFIHNVSFRGSDMRGVRLSLDEMGGGLCLYESDFTDANLDGADFTGAAYDSMTIFPDGFDPIQRGLVPLGESEEKLRILIERRKSQES